jgi:hypothetical protein
MQPEGLALSKADGGQSGEREGGPLLLLERWHAE